MKAREFFTFDAATDYLGRIIGYVRSLFDDPRVPGKASMARFCAAVAMAAGIWTTIQTVRFAFAVLAGNKGETGALGILAGLATTLFGTVCVGLLKRTTPTGASETIDDAPVVQPAAVVNIAQGNAGQ